MPDPIHNDREGHDYRSLMFEAKRRLHAIDQALDGQMDAFHPKFVEEFCYLQLRMICELIAFGCLIVHRDVKVKSKVFEVPQASWIVAEIAKLHPQFFPCALEVGGDGPDDWAPKAGGFLTMKELQDLWSKECGSRLHRGSVDKVMFNARNNVDMGKVKEWRDKIVELTGTP